MFQETCMYISRNAHCGIARNIQRLLRDSAWLETTTARSLRVFSAWRRLYPIDTGRVDDPEYEMHRALIFNVVLVLQHDQYWFTEFDTQSDDANALAIHNVQLAISLVQSGRADTYDYQLSRSLYNCQIFWMFMCRWKQLLRSGFVHAAFENTVFEHAFDIQEADEAGEADESDESEESDDADEVDPFDAASIRWRNSETFAQMSRVIRDMMKPPPPPDDLIVCTHEQELCARYIDHLLDAAAVQPKNGIFEKELLKSCTCSVSLQAFRDPVQADDGHTYERAHIQRHFDVQTRSSVSERGSGAVDLRSPMTNNPISNTNLRTNHALKAALYQICMLHLPRTQQETHETNSAQRLAMELGLDPSDDLSRTGVVQ